MREFLRPLLMAFFALILIGVVAWGVEYFSFSLRWHSFHLSKWTLPMASTVLLSFFIAWHWLAPVVQLAVEHLISTDPAQNIIRLSVAVITSTFVFRFVTPKGPEWFGHLGDFLNPPLTVLSLAILAVALGLQREDLKSTRHNLSLAQQQLEESARSRRVADAPWVSLSTLRETRDGVIAEIACAGGGPALNVCLELYEASGATITGRLACAALFAGPSTKKRLTLFDKDRVILPETLRMQVRWENVQKIKFHYQSDLQRTPTGVWSLSDQIEAVGQSYFHDMLGELEAPAARG